MKKFLNLVLVAGAAISLSACACVNAASTDTHASRQTAGTQPTYSKNCVVGKHSSNGDKVFSGKQHK